jgi:hypothetical protein
MHLNFSPLTMTQATPSRSQIHEESSSPLSRLSSIDSIELESPQNFHVKKSLDIEKSPRPALWIPRPTDYGEAAIAFASTDRDLPSTLINAQKYLNPNHILSYSPVATRGRCENNEPPASTTASLNKSVSDGLAITTFNDHDNDDDEQLALPFSVYYTTPKEKDRPSLQSRVRSTFSQIRAALQISPQGQALWQSIEDDHSISSMRWAWCLRKLVNSISVQRLGPVNHARECVDRLNSEIIKRLNAPNARISGLKRGLCQRDVIAALELLKSGGEEEFAVLELDPRRRRMLKLQYGPSGLLEEGLAFSRPFPKFGLSTVPEARDRIPDPDEDTAMQSDLNEEEIVLLGCENRSAASAASQNVDRSETAPPVDSDPNLHRVHQQLPEEIIHAPATHEKTPELPPRSASREQEALLKEVAETHRLDTTDKSPALEPLRLDKSMESPRLDKPMEPPRLDKPMEPPRLDKPVELLRLDKPMEQPKAEKPMEPILQGEPMLSIQSSPQNRNNATENTPQEVRPHTSRPYNFIPDPDPYTAIRSSSDVLPTPTNDSLITTYNPHTQNLVLIIDEASGNLDQVYPFQVYMQDSTLDEFFSFYSRVSGTPLDRIRGLEFGKMFGPSKRRRTYKVPRFNGEAMWMRLKEMATWAFEKAKGQEREKMEFAFMVDHV